MKCFFCKGMLLQNFTTHTIDLNTCVVIIRNVPCHKCAQCGEETYSLAVGERLEQIISTLKDSTTEVAIIKYTDLAA